MSGWRTVMNSNLSIGSIAHCRSGICGIVTKIESDRIVLRLPDGLKRVPIESIVQWELPTSTVKPRKLVLGDRVRYVGTHPSFKKQYGGELKIWELGKGCDLDKCACLTPEGKVSTWIDYSNLELVEVAA